MNSLHAHISKLGVALWPAAREGEGKDVGDVPIIWDFDRALFHGSIQYIRCDRSRSQSLLLQNAYIRVSPGESGYHGCPHGSSPSCSKLLRLLKKAI